MKDNLFDKKLKDTLGNLEAPYDPASWAALEQRLNLPFTEEQPAPVDAVDKAVFRTLERMEAPYQPAHWDLLARRMTLDDRRRRRVWITKFAEAAIFLLLLANLEGLLDTGTSTRPEPALQPAASPHLQAEAGRGRAQRNNSIAGREQPGTNDAALVDAENGLAAAETAALLATAYPAAGSQPGFDANGTALSAPLFDPAILQENSWVPLAAFASLFTNQPGQVQSAGQLFQPVPVNTKAPKARRFYAATFSNYDRNFVVSTGYTTQSDGYGGGTAIGYRLGKWGVEAGLTYSRRQYRPKKEVEIYGGNTVDGFYGSFAKNVDMDIVSVPVKATRRFARLGQMTAHATAGVTTHIAVDKGFQYGSTFYPGQAPSGSGSFVNQQPKLRKNGRGVLENGSLRNNVYATADLGVRLEHPVGRHFAAFIEPTYRQALGGKGVGPNPARINTFTVQAGVLATL